MRRAAARVASRRGSSMTMRLPASHGSSTSASGVTVVFPAPGGATNTALVPSRSASRNAGSASKMGSSSAMGEVYTPLALAPRQHAPHLSEISCAAEACMAELYHDGQRRLQHDFDTERLARRLEEVKVHDHVTADDKAFIERLDIFLFPT